MNRDSRPVPGSLRLAGVYHGIALCGALLLLGGCGQFGIGRTAALGAAASPAASTDPLVTFAANARPGTQARVVLAGGNTANLRLVRSYNAASGRECREVMIGTGTTTRPQLVCRGEDGAWTAARPLLRGSGGRP